MSAPGWGVASPVRCTPPLSENFTSDAEWFLPIISIAWEQANPGFSLDRYQTELIWRVLETYPPGHAREGELRFRQVVISLARQNGKSVIGAILGVYGLLRDLAAALVIGIASSSEQARIIYDRTLSVINANPSLKRLFARITDTRGIRSKRGGKYEIKAAKAAALQGLAITLGIVDELHILAADLWNALVSGTGGRSNCLVVGITTAGDDNSELLIQLYQNGDKAIAGDPDLERFGFFLWEAPEARIPDTRDEVVAYLLAANPSLAEGRIDLENVLADIAGSPPYEVIRYRFNRFSAAESAFISPDLWIRCQRGPLDPLFPSGAVAFALDRTPDYGFATITASIKGTGGVIHTEIVASITNPNREQLVAACIALARHNPSTFIMDGYSLRDVGKELLKRGLPVTLATQADTLIASSTLYAKVAQRLVLHGGEPLLAQQIPLTIRKNVGENFRIARNGSSVEIDAVMATALGIYAADTTTETALQIF